MTAYERRNSDWSSYVCSSDLVQVSPDCVGYGCRHLRCTTSHERCCNARIGCEPIEMLGLQLLQCPGSTERHCKAWRQLGPDHRADQIIERSEDSRPPAVFLSQQAEVLRMGVGVADDEIGRASCRESVGQYV